MALKRELRVLFVDDEVDFIEPVAFWLESKGYTVLKASSGRQAIETIKQQAPDIVFLDVMMPEMDGLQTLRRIREFNKDVPVVIVTAAYHDKARFSKFAEAGTLGIAGFFPKQSSLQELAQIIEVTLRLHPKGKTTESS